MNNELIEAIDQEKEILKSRVAKLYSEYYDNINYKLLNTPYHNQISIIEDLFSRLNIEVTLLEQNFKNKCIKMIENNIK